MRLTDKVRNKISSVLLGVVGAIFLLKYSSRIFDNINLSYLAAVIFLLGYLGISLLLQSVNLSKFGLASNRRIFLTALALIIIGFIVAVLITPEATRVSRLPAISEWLDRLLAGKFPWGGSTQYGPSGFPFLFLIALPFHSLGLLSYLEIVGLILFFIALSQLYPRIHTRWLPLMAALMLPTLYYEVLVRSELFFNIVLIIMLLLLSERYLNPAKLNFSFFGLAVLLGLGLSTRTIVGIIYAGYYAFKFRRQIFHGMIFSTITLIIFGLTLIPFIIWDAQAFSSEGPFAVQLKYIPYSYAIFFTIISAVAGWKASEMKEVLFTVGVSLFLIVTVAFILSAAQSGFQATVFNDLFDITYFIFCTPLLLLSFMEAPNHQAVNSQL